MENEILYNYFLTASEQKKESIRQRLTADELDYLEIMEASLNGDGNIELVALKTGMMTIQDELEELQLAYYLWQVEQYTNGEKSASLEKLLLADNWLFKETLADSANLNKDLTTVIQRRECEALRAHLPETAVKVVPLKNTRWLIKYVAVALIIGVVSLITFLVFNKTKNTDIIAKDSPDLIEKKTTPLEKYSPVVIAAETVINAIEPEHYGFAGRKKLAFKMVVENIDKQIDTLKNWYTLRDAAGVYASRRNAQIDSMLSYRNTYLYNDVENRLVLKLGQQDKVGCLLVPDQWNKRQVFIQLNNKFYEIKPAKMPQVLRPVTNRLLIESLQKIIFQNS